MVKQKAIYLPVDKIYPGELANLAIGQGKLEATPFKLRHWLQRLLMMALK